MGFEATKPVFGVSFKATLKPVSSASETCKKSENSCVASLDMMPSKKRITKVLVSLQGCAGLSPPFLVASPEGRFFWHRGSDFFSTNFIVYIQSYKSFSDGISAIYF